jgi:hypothetical protein
MGFMGRKSKLNSKVIKKVWLNKKDYKFQDFNFKVEKLSEVNDRFQYFYISVYNFNELILKLHVEENTYILSENRFIFEVNNFNPKTDNDCFSINHILAVCGESTLLDKQHKDKGNADVVNNQFIFRKRDSFYSFVKIWTKGDIKDDNYDKQLSYEFSTNEYIGYVKRVFGIKKVPRRKIKSQFKGFLDKIILLERL